MFPSNVYYDYAADEKRKLNEYDYRCIMDEYYDAFKRVGANNTEFVPANKRKIDGCAAMKSVFSEVNGRTIFRYFVGLNDAFETCIEMMQTDKLNTEIYVKQDGDDCADESRYGIMGILAKAAHLKVDRKKNSDFIVPKRDIQLREFGGLR